MIKWAVTFVVNRLMIAGFLLVAVSGLHGATCETPSGLMGQVDRAILGWKEIMRALDDAR